MSLDQGLGRGMSVDCIHHLLDRAFDVAADIGLQLDVNLHRTHGLVNRHSQHLVAAGILQFRLDLIALGSGRLRDQPDEITLARRQDRLGGHMVMRDVRDVRAVDRHVEGPAVGVVPNRSSQIGVRQSDRGDAVIRLNVLDSPRVGLCPASGERYVGVGSVLFIIDRLFDPGLQAFQVGDGFGQLQLNQSSSSGHLTGGWRQQIGFHQNLGIRVMDRIDHVLGCALQHALVLMQSHLDQRFSFTGAVLLDLDMDADIVRVRFDQLDPDFLAGCALLERMDADLPPQALNNLRRGFTMHFQSNRPGRSNHTVACCQGCGCHQVLGSQVRARTGMVVDRVHHRPGRAGDLCAVMLQCHLD